MTDGTGRDSTGAHRLRQQLRSPGAVRWYLGSIWGLIYLAIPVAISWVNMAPLPAALTTVILVAVGVAYVVAPPLMTGRSWRFAVVALLAFAALTCLAIPLLDVNVIWLWIYLPIITAFSWQPLWLGVTVLVTVPLTQLIVIVIAGNFADNWYAVALTVSIGIMMFAFAQQILTSIRLQASQSEVARLAVVDERERFARDVHDVLGHSLTVVAVKSELARKLVSSDPARAQTELEDIERMTRSALADLRAAVAGYHEMSLDTELAAAQAALTAAGIAPHLPASAAAAHAELQELFAWVVRESVTNIIRHSGARNCWVGLESRSLIISDDGRGGAALREPSGNGGLAGLSRRAEQSGATFTVEPGADGGTTVMVRAGLA